MMKSDRILPVTLACVMILLSIPTCTALYDFEGIPLQIVAKGAVQGEVLTFGSYGLTTPPVSCTFTLDRKPAFARVYAGVWGGTEQYKGWAEIRVNDQAPARYVLYGKDDRNEGVYTSGHGVYWIAQDATDLLQQGQNTITVTTSRGEPDNKLDGRVYAVLAVVADDRGNGPVTRYQLAEGNVNLHGEGWAGTNPTWNDNTSLVMDGVDTPGVSKADLTVLLVATSRGQPDYVMLNGRDLGQPASPQDEYLPGARDIGNERSFDANGGSGTDSRYVDIETFDVSDILKGSNIVLFERGRDLTGDGVITETGQKMEGEDYVHPCLALLAVKQPVSARLPDYSVTNLSITNAYTGKEARVSGTIWNSGIQTKNPVDVIFLVDNNPVTTVPVTIGPAGRADVSSIWPAVEGVHTITMSVSGEGDTDGSDNRISREIRVGSPPALNVAIGSPYRTGSGGESPTKKAPLSPFIAILGIFVTAAIIKHRSRGPGGLLITIVICTAFLSPVLFSAPAAAEGLVSYTLPLTVTNNGGSDAPPFEITIYIDGEKTAVTPVPDGIPAHASRQIPAQLYITPGSHTVKVVVDESGKISGSGAPSSVAEGVYAFP